MSLIMNFSRTNMIATAIIATLSLNSAGSLKAADTLSIVTMKPLQGVSFDIGTKHSVSYFLSDNGQCKLVLTLADEPTWNEVPTFTTIRFEAAVPVGKSTRFDSGEGKAVEFACYAQAQTMSAKLVDEVIIDASR